LLWRVNVAPSLHGLEVTEIYHRDQNLKVPGTSAIGKLELTSGLLMIGKEVTDDYTVGPNFLGWVMQFRYLHKSTTHQLNFNPAFQGCR